APRANVRRGPGRASPPRRRGPTRDRRSRTAARTASPRPRSRAPPSTPRPSRQRPYFRNAAGGRVEAAPRSRLERTAHQKARGERVAGTRGIDDLGVDRGEVELRVLREDGAAARSALQHANRGG